MPLTALEIATLVDGEVVGDATITANNIAAIDKAGSGDVSFAVDASNLKRMASTGVSIVLIPDGLREQLPTDGQTAFIVTKEPRGAFVKILTRMRKRRERPDLGISAQAIVARSAEVGHNTNIHPGAIIGEDVVIGDRCDIHSGTVIGAGCRIGNDVTVYPSAVLYPDVVLRNRVIVHAAVVLGADGFGYRQVDGIHEKIPHFGSVIVEDDVEIGAGTTIDRAMVGATTIGEGTKIDNQVMIAHNCELGRHNLIVSQTGFAGSSTTGEHVVVAGQVGVADHVSLGDRCVVAAQSGVTKSLAGDTTYLGSPADRIEDTMKCFMALKRLPEMRKQLRLLEKQVAALTQQFKSATQPHSVGSEHPDSTQSSARIEAA